MMDQSKCHLMTLPREMRNGIYQAVIHGGLEICIETFGDECYAASTPDRVTLHTIYALLETCPEIHDEFLEELRLSGTLHIRPHRNDSLLHARPDLSYTTDYVYVADWLIEYLRKATLSDCYQIRDWPHGIWTVERESLFSISLSVKIDFHGTLSSNGGRLDWKYTTCCGVEARHAPQSAIVAILANQIRKGLKDLRTEVDLNKQFTVQDLWKMQSAFFLSTNELYILVDGSIGEEQLLSAEQMDFWK